MNVQEVQRRLWERSRAHREHREAGRPLFPTNPYENRVRNLMDLMHQPDWLHAAMERTVERSKGKAPGVDGVTTYKYTRHGLDQKIEQLRLELKSGTYRPKPLRRVEIPKANGTMRPLGIPCLRDKIVQEAVRMALEPIFEMEFHDNSYGFRPNRSAHHAVFRCQHLMRAGFSWVIEGDVKACFDEISHEAILKAVREKVMDNKFLELIDLFLKAGVKIDGKFHPTVQGVPQGGVVSPLLANAVLNKLDWFLQSKARMGISMQKAYANSEPNIRFTRYADDWCVFLTRTNKRYAESLKEEISEFLEADCGLRLSLEKTKVTHVRDGFDFLGFHMEKGIGQKGKSVPKSRWDKRPSPTSHTVWMKRYANDRLKRASMRDSSEPTPSFEAGPIISKLRTITMTSQENLTISPIGRWSRQSAGNSIFRRESVTRSIILTEESALIRRSESSGSRTRRCHTIIEVR